MTTLIFSAVGTMLGGPLGGALGALVGNQIDNAILKPGGRDGARVKELHVTNSSYGTPLARHFGKVRAGGSIIWSTDLTESQEKHGGGKGAPSSTAFTYAVSFAVGLASRPIAGLGRIWADGNLLRGAEGDLKVGGTLRVYHGHGDQPIDPLLASALGPECPAFRGLAYCVFEDLQLTDFGNRIPALTFEIIADDGDVSLEQLVGSANVAADIDRPLAALTGFSDEGGSLAVNLETIDQVYPLTCDASGTNLTIRAADIVPAHVPLLPEAAADPAGDSFAGLSGESRRRHADLGRIPEGMRYYDVARDFQAGLQRADGRARVGRSRIIEFPGALDADTARQLANKAAERAASSSEGLAWRLPELDPNLAPGMVVRVPRRTGLWRIEDWEWREAGVELHLQRLPHGPTRAPSGDAGTALPAADLPATPTYLAAFEMPWDGQGSGAQRQVFAACSSAGAGWSGATIFGVCDGVLAPIVASGRRRSVLGQLAAPLGAGSSTLLCAQGEAEIDLFAADLQLVSTTLEGMAQGSNRALIGEEIVQFLNAERVGQYRWRISGLLRGRGGTEQVGLDEHQAGTPFVLLDEAPVSLDAVLLGNPGEVAALGLNDPAPVIAPIIAAGRTLRPLCPVHPRAGTAADGSLELRWTRRARAAWEWRDLVDVPLQEEVERYVVGAGSPDNPAAMWEITETWLSLAPTTVSSLSAAHPGAPLWVRQVGSHAASPPLLLHSLA